MAGLELTGPAAEAERQHLFAALRDAAAAAAPVETIRLLREAQFFGDQGLRRAIETFGVARVRFVVVLDLHAASRSVAPLAG